LENNLAVYTAMQIFAKTFYTTMQSM